MTTAAAALTRLLLSRASAARVRPPRHRLCSSAPVAAALHTQVILLAPPLQQQQQQCITSAAAAAMLAWVDGSGRMTVCERRHRCRCSGSSDEPASQQQHMQQQQQQQQQPPGWRHLQMSAAHAWQPCPWPSQGVPASWQLQQQRAHSSTTATGSSSSSSSPPQPGATPAGAGGGPAGAEPDEDEVYLDDELQVDEGEEPLLPADHVARGDSCADVTQTSLLDGSGGGKDSVDEFEVILDAFEEFDEGFAWEDEEGVEDELTVRGKEEEEEPRP